MNNYKLLRPLLSLLQTRNLTLSAHQLNVTQSAMSRSLLQIREAFDDPILIREGQNFILTQRGEELLIELPGILTTLDSLYLTETFNPASCKRRFHLAYTSFLSSITSALICSELEKVSPYLSIDSQLWQGQSLSDDEMKKVDLVASIADTIPENIYGKKLIEDSYVAVMSKSCTLANEPLTLESYVRSKHVLVRSITNITKQVDKVMQPTGYERKVLANVPSFFDAFKVIDTTEAIITVPRHIIAEYCNIFDLKVKPLPFKLETHPYYLLWHAKYQNDPEHKWFREFCFPLLKNYLETAIEKGQQLTLSKVPRA
ncbi:transcriptional regulator [Shewanella psychrophila]|uniref:Transcriptional regulator n=1 Tax=Shewanella psychrophila TaxID=225848 RepID=A0A1S6HYJ0_9GAMM|nr:LysR family transcriptional regulator [Shewanella psychrophila]AQS40581.1 transcriptional regulator [Shewanella psychrophila]